MSIPYEHLVYTVWSEGENCSLPEKELIAITLINRYTQRKITFNDYKIDYEGWNLQKRQVHIRNEIEREAFFDCFKAVDNAYKKFMSKEYENLYFFNMSGKLNLKYYKIEKYIPEFKTKHTFFKIKEV